MANTRDTYRRKYGLDWPKNIHDIQIDLILAKKWGLKPYKFGSFEDPDLHMLRAMRALFTKEQWGISPWTEQHVRAWCCEDFSVWLGAASTGKAQPLDAEVLTPVGPVPMSDIQVGDLVIGLDGHPVKVTDIHDAGVRDEYEVRAADGRTALCADDHLWTVLNRNSRYRVSTVRAKDLMPGSHMLPAAGLVQFAERPTPVDPYTLGALLGDGTMGAASGSSPLSITNVEKGVLDLVRNGIPEGCELVHTAGCTWRIVKEPRRNGGANELICALKGMSLWAKRSYEKFIPDSYLYNTVKVREGVLAGLLDTDGTVGSRGDITYTSTSRRLAEGVAALVRSLGGRASISTKRNTGYRGAGGFVKCREAYNVHISFPDMLYAAKLFPGSPAKKARVRAKKFRSVGIESAAPTGRRVPMKCITVAAEDGLYLTGSYMPTHNSNDVGGLAVLDWVTDPTDTYTALASTSVQMLKIRSYESVIRYFRHLKGNPHFLIPGKEATSMTAIINDNEDERNQATIKASVRGVALQDGGAESKAIAKLAGAHLPFVTIILDEGSALPPAAAKARINASAGTKRFRFVSLANPVSFNDEATKFCEPLDGWPTVDERTPEWRSRFGLVLHHNGYDSPAYSDEGAEEFPYLINRKQIETIVREEGHNNEDAPIVWCMVKGYPCPVGLENTVLSEADIVSFNLKGDPEWAEMYSEDSVRVAGLDPAFTSGGDNCVLQTATVGFLRGGVYAIAFDPPDYVPIKASSNRPAIYQVVEGTRDLLVQKGIPLENVGIDDSGTQSVADVYEVELGVVPVRCSFASKASEEFSETGEALQKKFANLVTEMWADVAKLGRNGQLRGLNNKAALQFCSRFYKKGIKPLALESKKDYKKRLSGQNSPDEGDALSICARVAKIKAGLVPGGGKDIGIMEKNPISSIVNVSKKLSSSYGKGLDISRLKGYRIPK